MALSSNRYATDSGSLLPLSGEIILGLFVTSSFFEAAGLRLYRPIVEMFWVIANLLDMFVILRVRLWHIRFAFWCVIHRTRLYKRNRCSIWHLKLLPIWCQFPAVTWSVARGDWPPKNSRPTSSPTPTVHGTTERVERNHWTSQPAMYARIPMRAKGHSQIDSVRARQSSRICGRWRASSEALEMPTHS